MLTIIDYGLGNLNSVKNMIDHVGETCKVTSNLDEIACAEKLILPGVGAFDRGIEALRESGLETVLSEAVLTRGVPILGICLGMQLMTKKSDEGQQAGLGWLDAEVKKFEFQNSSELKIPHMGWNSISIQKNNELIKFEDRQRFYFVHSYHVVCNDKEDILATCDYGYSFVAAFARGNIYGVQFHPEKSHRFGMNVLRQFVEIMI